MSGALRHPVNQRHHTALTRGESLAGAMARVIGSWRFLIAQSLALGAWVALNIVAIARHWDPYPFILLNLMLSFQAAYTGPILLIASNRQTARDRDLAEHMFATEQAVSRLLVLNTKLTREVHMRVTARPGSVFEGGERQ